jgi:hypothetical protein
MRDEDVYHVQDKTDGLGPALAQQGTYIPPWNPFAARIWNGEWRRNGLSERGMVLNCLPLGMEKGTCEQGQLTNGGLLDAVSHGNDFWGVYGPNGINPLLSDASAEEILLRTSPEKRTVQVASALLRGMGYEHDAPFKVHASPSVIVSLLFVHRGDRAMLTHTLSPDRTA